MGHKEVNAKKKERWPITGSAAFLLSNSGENFGGGYNFYKELILVRKREAKTWGLIAGGVKQRETFEMAIWRELKEETGLNQESIVNDSFSRSRIIEIPSEEKTSIGIIFRGCVKKSISAKGYEPNSKEVDFVKPFSLDNILDLIDNPKAIFKPEYNKYLFNYWVWSFLQMKYSFEGYKFAKSVAQNWGLDKRVFDF